MTRQLKIADLLYFKGKIKNNHITIDKNIKNEYDFNIMVSIIK